MALVYPFRANPRIMVKFKTYENEMTNGREIMNIATCEQTKQMPNGETNAAEMLKWHHVDVKIGSRNVTGNVARFILNK